MSKYFRHIKRFKKHADGTLIFRICFFCVGYLIILGIIINDLVEDKISFYLALVGLAIGAFISYLTRKMFITRWKEENRKVALRLDFSAVLSISLYLFFVLTRDWFFSQWVIKKNLDAFVFSSIAGAMLARIIMILFNFNKILSERKIE